MRLPTGNCGLSPVATRPNTRDRLKVARQERFRAGTFRWRVYTPPMGRGDQASIGTLLYSDDKRGVDFEIGYGKALVRKRLKARRTTWSVVASPRALPI